MKPWSATYRVHSTATRPSDTAVPMDTTTADGATAALMTEQPPSQAAASDDAKPTLLEAAHHHQIQPTAASKMGFPASHLDGSMLLRGDRVRLPQSAMEQLAASGQLGTRTRPLMLLAAATPRALQLALADKKQDTQATGGSNKVVACGVLDFGADNGQADLPRWMEQALQLQHGDSISFVVAELPRAESCEIQACDLAFYRLQDQRAALESALMTQCTTLTKGERIRVEYEGRLHTLFVVDLLPADRCCVVDTDVEVKILRPAIPDPDAAQLDQAGPTELLIGGNVSLNISSTHFTYLQFRVDAADATVQIGCAAVAEDFEAYIARVTGSTPSPTRDCHLLAPDHDRLSAATFTIKASAHPDAIVRTGPYMLGLRALTAAPCIVQITYDVAPTPDGPAAAVADASDRVVCKNCHQAVPAARLALHTAYCERNNIACSTCGKAYLRAQPAQHQHCTICQELSTSDAESAKHMLLRHTPMPCTRCSAVSLPMAELQEHHRTDCTERMVTCRYCHNLVRAGAPATDLHARYRGLTEHESYCAGKTETCPDCRRPVKLRDWDSHRQVHEFDRNQRNGTALSASNSTGSNSGSSGSNGSSGSRNTPSFSWTSPTDPAVVRAQADRARARLFGQIDPEFAGTASAFGQHDDDDAEAIIRTMQSASDQQERLVREQQQLEASIKARARPIKPVLCDNYHCMNVLPSSSSTAATGGDAIAAAIASGTGLCQTCYNILATVDATITPEPTAVLRALFKLSFLRMTQPCPCASCVALPRCCTVHDLWAKTDGSATACAAAALELARKAFDPAYTSTCDKISSFRYLICVDPGMEEQYQRACALAQLAGVGLPWASYALRLHSNPDRAAMFLLDSAPQFAKV
ncbi:hypothetical protein CAOG_008221 [Capsaspora owczarzaki ATCC 30864]|uniref:TRAF-type domain-containing protein n=2 Tax=Capsaspora owczarzaki (strain ATCC 30864) TaxID=595528 RepID=A0A0D2WXZ9_CAPO3|nr:hypothetical protein CAOG_008221 [Capsaspora owczarzaki ATCC 30864]